MVSHNATCVWSRGSYNKHTQSPTISSPLVWWHQQQWTHTQSLPLPLQVWWRQLCSSPIARLKNLSPFTFFTSARVPRALLPSRDTDTLASTRREPSCMFPSQERMVCSNSCSSLTKEAASTPHLMSGSVTISIKPHPVGMATTCITVLWIKHSTHTHTYVCMYVRTYVHSWWEISAVGYFTKLMKSDTQIFLNLVKCSCCYGNNPQNIVSHFCTHSLVYTYKHSNWCSNSILPVL